MIAGAGSLNGAPAAYLLEPAQDADADGTGTDDWETFHGFDPNNAADAQADADGDGENNLAEFFKGDDPWAEAVAGAVELLRYSNPRPTPTAMATSMPRRQSWAPTRIRRPLPRHRDPPARPRCRQSRRAQR
ncbi:MAG: hypothetical protein R3F11_32700 [Verrucomicrobiales bacterium]